MDPEKVHVPVAVPPAVRVSDEGQVTVKAPPTTVLEMVILPANPPEPDGRLWSVRESVADPNVPKVMLEAAGAIANPVTWMVSVAEV